MNDTAPSAVLICQFRGCAKELPVDSQFPYCSVCRILKANQEITLMTDPESRLPYKDSTRLGLAVQQTLTTLTGTEFINWLTNVEAIYLELKKLQFLLAPAPSPRKAVKTLQDQVSEQRQKELDEGQTKKQRVIFKKDRKAKTTIEKQMKALGVDEKTARQVFNDDFGDI